MAQLNWQNVNMSGAGSNSASSTAAATILDRALSQMGSTLDGIQARRDEKVAQAKFRDARDTAHSIGRGTYSVDEAIRYAMNNMSDLDRQKRTIDQIGSLGDQMFTTSEASKLVAAGLAPVSQINQNLTTARSRLNLAGSGNRLQRIYNDAQKVSFENGLIDGAAYLRDKYRKGDNDKEGETFFEGYGQMQEQLKEVMLHADRRGISPEVAIMAVEHTLGGTNGLGLGNSKLQLEADEAKELIDQFAGEGVLNGLDRRYQNMQSRNSAIEGHGRTLADLTNKYAIAHGRGDQAAMDRFAAQINQLNTAVSDMLGGSLRTPNSQDAFGLHLGEVIQRSAGNGAGGRAPEGTLPWMEAVARDGAAFRNPAPQKEPPKLDKQVESAQGTVPDWMLGYGQEGVDQRKNKTGLVGSPQQATDAVNMTSIGEGLDANFLDTIPPAALSTLPVGQELLRSIKRPPTSQEVIGAMGAGDDRIPLAPFIEQAKRNQKARGEDVAMTPGVASMFDDLLKRVDALQKSYE